MYNAFLLNISKFSLLRNNSNIASATLASLPLGKNLSNLSSNLGLEQRLRDVGIPETACETMAKDAMKQTRLLINNPKEISENDAYDIYKSAW